MVFLQVSLPSLACQEMYDIKRLSVLEKEWRMHDHRSFSRRFIVTFRGWEPMTMTTSTGEEGIVPTGIKAIAYVKAKKLPMG